jgi:hypothetical protein
MPWYKTGTVKTTVSTNAIVGTGTAFIANSRVGDAFRGPDGAWYEVTNIASDTAMSISPVYQGATVAAGAYALAPMQGYVKASADALNALVNAFGATIAVFNGASDAPGVRNALSAAKSGANTDITSLAGLTTALSLAQGGTGNATGTATKLATGIMVGTVSQTSGVPTGALMEAGSNSNGLYEKYACGTLICTSSDAYSPQTINQAYGNIFISSSPYTTKTYPYPFAALPRVSQFLTVAGALAFALPNALATLTAWPSGYFAGPVSSGSTNYSARLDQVAIGRWF